MVKNHYILIIHDVFYGACLSVLAAARFNAAVMLLSLRAIYF